MTGANPIQDVSFVSRLAGVPATVPFYHAIVHSLPHVLGEMARNPRYLSPRCLPMYAKSYLVAAANALGYKRLRVDLVQFGVFGFLGWDEQEVQARISSESGWDHPRGTYSQQRFDCPVAYLKNFIYRTALGVCKIDEYYAMMVREGLVERAEALRRLEQDSRFDEERVQALLERLGIRERPAWERLRAARTLLDDGWPRQHHLSAEAEGRTGSRAAGASENRFVTARCGGYPVPGESSGFPGAMG